MLHRQRGVRLQKGKICGEVLWRIGVLQKRARDELIEIGTVVVKPGIDITRGTGFKGALNTQAVHSDVREALFRELSHVGFAVEMTRIAEAAYKKIVQVT
jgi:hypothetical protein